MAPTLLGRAAASAVIVTLSAIVIQLACLRSSTIYFFELDHTTVLFLTREQAFAFPLALSALLGVVYMATKRMKAAEEERRKEEEEAVKKREEESKSPPISRKVSRAADLRPIFELPQSPQSPASPPSAGTASGTASPPAGEEEVDGGKLRRMLSAISEQQDATPPRKEGSAEGVNEAFSLSDEEERRSTEDSVEDEEAKIIEPEETIRPPMEHFRSRSNTANSTSALIRLAAREAAAEASVPGSRRSSFGSRAGLLHLSSRRESFSAGAGKTGESGQLMQVSATEEQARPPAELYKELGQIDLLTYFVNAITVLPREIKEGEAAMMRRDVRISDILSDLAAVHVPVWACVAALHVVLLEMLANKAAFYFYYHEETMAYAALIAAIGFGLVHEFAGGWLSNDVLALASVYVVVSRVQLVSYQTAVVLAGGLIIFDLFWIYVVDLLSTVTRESRAPLMILIPRDNEGGKQSLATLDIMAPGVLLNLLLKFNAMYDPRVYTACWQAAMAGLAVTMAIAVWRRKITPALVLPLAAVLVTSASIVDRPFDLWRFAIKH